MKKDNRSRIFRAHGFVKKQSLVYSFLMVSFLFLSFGLSAQERMIQGSVYDASTNEPLIGVAVIIKGSSIGTITDIDGAFSLSASSESVFVFSSMGYESQDVTVGNRSVMEVKLKEDAKVLDEVVVVGFGEQKKVNITGSVGVAKATEIESRPVTNAMQALQGLVTGLNVTQKSGSLDKTAELNIRGRTTIGEGSDGSPLVLIDGMEGDLSSINPQDIESVSVLKDAAASSIYGSRAPYGVILVTTKTGQEGRATVNYNNNFRWGSPIVKMNQMDSETYMYYFNQANRNGTNSTVNYFSDQTMQNVRDYRSGLISGPLPMPQTGTQWSDIGTVGYADTDWYDLVFKDYNSSQEHNLSMSGGSDKATYYLSLNYMGQQGLLKVGEDGLKRYNVAAKISARPTKWARINYSSRFTRSDYYKPSNFNDGLYENLGRDSSRPNMPLYDNNGYLLGGQVRDIIMGGDHNRLRDVLYQQLNVELEPLKGLFVIGDFNYRIDSEESNSVYLKSYNHDIYGEPLNVESAPNSLTYSTNKVEYMNATLRARYERTFNDVHNFHALAGTQVEDYGSEYHSSTGHGFLTEDLPYADLLAHMNGTKPDDPEFGGPGPDEWASAGFFGRINYDYKERYLLELNYRRDGSSRYRAERRWSSFPSASAGWNIAHEKWMASLGAINTLKLRASFGELGNSNTQGNYPTYLVLNPDPDGGLWLQNGKYTAIVNTPEPKSAFLTWETIRTLDIGLDWGLFNSRLTGSFDYYTRSTLDMLIRSERLPSVFGVGTMPFVNSGDLMTYGWEFEIQWKDRLKNGLEYSAKFMLSDNQTKLLSYLLNPTNNLGAQGYDYVEGEMMGNVYGYTTIGIAQSNEEMQAHLAQLDANYESYHGEAPLSPGNGQSAMGRDWGAGDIMYADLNGDGVVNKGSGTLEDHGDWSIIGNNTPRYMFGIDLNAAWKGFDIRAFFQGVMQRDVWQGSIYFWGAYTEAAWSTAMVEHLDFWRDENSYVVQEGFMEPNLDAYYPRPTFDRGGDTGRDAGRNRQMQTRYLQDASYIRLKNLQVGYTLPATWTKKVGIEKVRIYFSGENLWTGTKLAKMFDPETVDGGNNNSSADWRARNTGNAYPLSKTFSCGLSVTL